MSTWFFYWGSHWLWIDTLGLSGLVLTLALKSVRAVRRSYRKAMRRHHADNN